MMKFQERSAVIGTYVLAALDAAASRGYLSEAALNTMNRGLLSLYSDLTGISLDMQGADKSQGAPTPGIGSSTQERQDALDLLTKMQKQRQDLIDRQSG